MWHQVGELLSPRFRLRLNFSSYAAPGAAPLRMVLIGLAALMLLGIAWDVLEVWGLHAEVGELARSVARLREQDQRLVDQAGQEGADLSTAAVTRLPAEVRFINGVIEKRTFSWTHFLSELERTVPGGVGVTSIRLEPARLTIQLSGTARTFEDVTAFLTLLHDHPEFREPLLKQHRGRDDGLVEFQVMLQYRHHDTHG